VLEKVCSDERGVNPSTLEQVLMLAVQIAREGREGRKVGTLFVIGDTDAVLARSRTLILDPLAGHPEEARRLDDPNLRETIKELAQLDGGFVVSDEGVVVSGTRYFDASSEGVEMPLGLGTRHIAAASITNETKAVAVVVSESSVVRVFDDGRLVSEILPELWMLQVHGLLAGERDVEQSTEGDLTVVQRTD
ncbi:MAG: DNA integrity scanning protein DisA nucleotide-binding domain protein, partial [Polyangiales bacterium]